MEKEITNAELLESINRSFSKVEKKMATKDDLLNLKLELKNDLETFRLETNIHFNNLETDLKSFKKDTNDSIKKTEEDVADIVETNALYDKRIEKMENKFV